MWVPIVPDEFGLIQLGAGTKISVSTFIKGMMRNDVSMEIEYDDGEVSKIRILLEVDESVIDVLRGDHAERFSLSASS